MKKTVRRTHRLRSGPPHVALIVETSTIFGRRLLRGVSIYSARERTVVRLFGTAFDLRPGPALAEELGRRRHHLAQAYPGAAQLVLRTGIPAVDLQEQVLGLGLPRIVNDNEAIGRMAAAHLLERGFAHFGFIGHPGIGWSEGRRDGFAATVTAAGHVCDDYRAAGKTLPRYQQQSWEKEMDHAASWVRALPKPAGILAGNDFLAVQLLDACRRGGVAVPEEVAVIGVDNDEVACEMAHPPLSSVVTNALQIGYEAAAALDALMRGKRTPAEECISSRQPASSRGGARKLRRSPIRWWPKHEYLRQHACDGINVDDLLRHLAVSRSVLQRRFQKTLQKTVHEVLP